MKIEYSSKFKKDLKLAKKQNKDLNLLQEILNILLSGEPLPEKYKDHVLCGNYVTLRECHIKPDWLLIYKTNDDTLYLYRLGSHSELFNK